MLAVKLLKSKSVGINPAQQLDHSSKFHSPLQQAWKLTQYIL